MNSLISPSSSEFYYPIIMLILGIFAILNFISFSLDNDNTDQNEDIVRRTGSMSNYSIKSATTIANFITKDQLQSKNKLRYNYLICYLLVRASIWSKSPYMFVLYYEFHKLTIEDIGVLYIIDSISSFISAPFLGVISDKFGRKFSCILYNVSVISNLLLRLTGDYSCAFIAQILTGIGSGLLNTAYESWVVCESGKIFIDDKFLKQKFLKKLFKNATVYDGAFSLLITSISAVLYTNYGLFSPIYFSMSFSIVGGILIFSLWNENYGEENNKKSIIENLIEGVEEIRNDEKVFLIGVIESIINAAFGLFLFGWTPLLSSISVDGKINVGFAFITFIMCLVSGATVFEIVSIKLKVNPYKSLFSGLIAVIILFIITVYSKSFVICLISLAFINGAIGYILPLISTIKSEIIKEKHRSQIMCIYRVPLNILLTILLLLTKLFNTKQVFLISAFIQIVSLIISYHLKGIYKPDKKEYPLFINEKYKKIQEENNEG